MRHIKTYENIFNRESYKVGDYVIVDVRIDYLPELGKILKINNGLKKTYIIELISDDDTNLDEIGYKSEYLPMVMYSVKRSEIIRKLTPEEVEQHKLKIASKKYNL